MLRAGSLWFPLAMVVAIIGFVITLTWVLSSERNQIYGRIDTLAGTMQALANGQTALTATVERIASRIGTPDQNSLTRQQWLIECLQMQISNVGWFCPYGRKGSPWKPAVEEATP